MAFQKEINVSGKLNNLVFYSRGGKHLVRMAPDKVKRTSNMKKRSTNFGVAVKAAAVTRRFLKHVIPFPRNRDMQNKFGGAFSKWLGRIPPGDQPSNDLIPYISGFRFDRASYGHHWIENIKLVYKKDQTVLQIPAFTPDNDLTAPPRTMAVECRVAAVTVNLKEGAGDEDFETSFIIPYTTDKIAARQIIIPLTAKPGHILITGLSLRYKVSQKGEELFLQKEGYMPSVVVGAVYKKG